MKRVFFILFICQTIGLSSLEYAIDAKVSGDQPITSYKIFGERNSGTNFLQELVGTNLLNGDKFIKADESLGHKHYPCWYELPLEFYKNSPRLYTLEGSENVLFFVIYRNPYDWLRSMRSKPFDADPSLRDLNFSTFIRTKWKLNIKRELVRDEMKKNPWVDRNPKDGSLFQNVMKLRTAKIRAMNEVKNRVNNIYYINYETLRDHPEKVLEEIADLFDLQKSDVYRPVIYKKATKKLGVYKEKKYPPISTKDLKFINSQLDSEVENNIGYFLVHNSSEIK